MEEVITVAKGGIRAFNLNNDNEKEHVLTIDIEGTKWPDYIDLNKIYKSLTIKVNQDYSSNMDFQIKNEYKRGILGVKD